MKKVIRQIHFILLVCLLGFSSCNSGTITLKPKEIKSYASNPKNGLLKEVLIGGIQYKFIFRPARLMAYIESAPDSVMEQRVAELSELYWFNIEFRKESFAQSPLRYNLSGLEEYNIRLDYYLNYAINDIWLVTDSDTLKPVSYWFENNHNLTNHETIVLGFEKKPSETKKLQLFFNDQLFKSGIVKATFFTADTDKSIVIKD